MPYNVLSFPAAVIMTPLTYFKFRERGGVAVHKPIQTCNCSLFLLKCNILALLAARELKRCCTYLLLKKPLLQWILHQNKPINYS